MRKIAAGNRMIMTSRLYKMMPKSLELILKDWINKSPHQENYLLYTGRKNRNWIDKRVKNSYISKVKAVALIE